MSKWTPTPWEVETPEHIDEMQWLADGARTDWVGLWKNGLTLGSCYMGTEDENRINANRIVACVNAFHSEDGRSIDTENIEVGLVWELMSAIQAALTGRPEERRYAAAVLAKLEPEK